MTHEETLIALARPKHVDLIEAVHGLTTAEPATEPGRGDADAGKGDAPDHDYVWVQGPHGQNSVLVQRFNDGRQVLVG